MSDTTDSHAADSHAAGAHAGEAPDKAPNDEVLTPGNVGTARIIDGARKDGSDSAVASEENSTNPE